MLWAKLILILAALALATAAPQKRPRPRPRPKPPRPTPEQKPAEPKPMPPVTTTSTTQKPETETGFIPIVSQEQVVGFEGIYKYKYETANGISVEESGYLKHPGQGDDVEAQVSKGFYSYTAPDGTPIKVTYIADDLGFQPEGDHLPVPPPIPPLIQKALDFLATQTPETGKKGKEGSKEREERDEREEKEEYDPSAASEEMEYDYELSDSQQYDY